MQDLNDKVNNGGATAAGQLDADEWNQVPSEIQNVIEGLGITLSGGDLNQLGKAIAGYIANGDFYSDSGAADAYVLSAIGSKQAPPSYTDGMRVGFIPTNDNTGASTVNVAGLGVKNITATATAGLIVSGERIDLVYNNASGEFEIVPSAVLSKDFVSAEQTITSGGSLTLAHGLPSKPPLIQAVIINKTAELGYSIGDEMVINSSQSNSGGSSNRGTSIVADSTNVNIRYGSALDWLAIARKDTGASAAITIANWKLIVRAWV